MNSLIIISTPAGGKSVISEYIEKKYKFTHISTGDLFRDEVENNTEIGKKISNRIENGKLVNDEVLFTVLRNRLNNQKGNYILDGTPRELHQAKMYDSLLEELNIKLIKVIYLKVDKEVAINRMLDRVVCEYCNKSYSLNKNGDKCNICGRSLTRRNDDNTDTFNKRYDTFVKRTLPLIDYYNKKDLVVTVTNNTELEDAFNQIDEIMRGE